MSSVSCAILRTHVRTHARSLSPSLSISLSISILVPVGRLTRFTSATTREAKTMHDGDDSETNVDEEVSRARARPRSYANRSRGAVTSSWRASYRRDSGWTVDGSDSGSGGGNRTNWRESGASRASRGRPTVVTRRRRMPSAAEGPATTGTSTRRHVIRRHLQFRASGKYECFERDETTARLREVNKLTATRLMSIA